MGSGRRWITVLLLLLCGCGALPSDQPEWIVNRLPLTACREEVVERGDTDVEARQCLLDAFRAGEGAELITTQSSGEAPLVTRRRTTIVPRAMKAPEKAHHDRRIRPSDASAGAIDGGRRG